MTKKALVILIIVFAVIGMIIAGYSVFEHYDMASAEFCSLSEKVDCGVVNHSKYSTLFGIPVAILGALSYLTITIGAIWYFVKNDKRAVLLITFLSIFGLIFSLYLTYIEAYVLYTWCLLCLGSQFTIAILTVLTVWLKNKVEKKLTLENIHE